MENRGLRINKYISLAGVCSRREADRRIAEGRVMIDGTPATAGDRVLPGQKVYVDNEEINLVTDEVVLIFNKPVGIVCTAEKREPQNVIDFIGYPERIYPVGRLDKDSRGLLLLTNAGDLAYEITKASSGHDKEYEVRVDHPITGPFLIAMQKGVHLRDLDKTTAPAKVKKLSDNSFSITLHQGLNRQIRRMCSELGYKVLDLKRIRELDLTLDGIEEGQYRKLTAPEVAELRRKIYGN